MDCLRRLRAHLAEQDGYSGARTPFQESLVVWTARAAVAAYAVSIGSWLWRPRAGPGSERARLVSDVAWTIAGAVFLIHVALAFQYLHHWSHAAAFQHTAERTAQAIGRAVGEGIYVNYVFLAWWFADLMLLWTWPAVRTPAYRGAVHGFFAFILFNATIVFGPPWWRWTLIPLAVAARSPGS